jgi:hypothetical protein
MEPRAVEVRWCRTGRFTVAACALGRATEALGFMTPALHHPLLRLDATGAVVLLTSEGTPAGQAENLSRRSSRRD